MFIATCPPGLEDLLETELVALGAQGCRRSPGGVHFAGPWSAAMDALLWARLPNRILHVLARYPAHNRTELFDGARALPWHQWLHPQGTISVHCARGEGDLNHTHFVALVVKDAMVDALRESTGSRPQVDTTAPDARIHVHIRRGEALLAFDLSGDSLHRRGYRLGGGDAPLKENVAAAMLLRSGWPAAAAAGQALIDPMCGSGTLLIEAALLARSCPANAHRDRFGIDGLKTLDAPLWSRARAKAQAARQQALGSDALAQLQGTLFGSDIDPRQLSCARAQARAAGVLGSLALTQRDVSELVPPPGADRGIIVTNPPYGARLGGSEADVRALMGRLGRALGAMAGFTSHVLVADPEMGFALKLRAIKSHSIMHGGLACTLLHLRSSAAQASDDQSPAVTGRAAQPGQLDEPSGPPRATAAKAQPLCNRLHKNLRARSGYLQQENITAYRLYDGDLPEYAVAIDVYEDTTGTRHAHIQEYAAPKEVPEALARARLRQVLDAVGEVLQLPPERMALKVRRRQRPEDRYGKSESRRLPGLGHSRAQGQRGGFWVQEHGLRLFVDLHSYVDSGLFLDHRRVRAWMLKQATGKHVLNLFGYTGSVSLAAARGGASSTTTVDLSATYLDWAAHNFRENGLLQGRHRFEQADCLQWLEEARGAQYDIAFINPPTFSNSKRMDEDFDLVRDHGALLTKVMQRVADHGTALFTTHARRLRMDPRLTERFAVSEVTRAMRPKDFDGAKRGCRAWLIRHRPGA